AACRREHARTEMLRQADPRLTPTPRARMNQYALSRLESANVDECAPRSSVCHRQCRCFRRRQCARCREHEPDRHDDLAREAARPERDDAVAGLERVDSRTALRHDAATLEPQVRGVRIASERDEDVTEIETGGQYADADVSIGHSAI